MVDQDTTEGKDRIAGPSTPAQNTPAAQDAAAPLAVPSSPSGKLGDDIAQILKSVKLPERHDNASNKKQIENKAALFDTTLGLPAQAGTPNPSVQTDVQPREIVPEKPAPAAPVPPALVVPQPAVVVPPTPIVPQPQITVPAAPVVPQPAIVAMPAPTAIPQPKAVIPPPPVVPQPVVTAPSPSIVPQPLVTTPLPPAPTRTMQQPAPVVIPEPVITMEPIIQKSPVPKPEPVVIRPEAADVQSSVVSVHTLKDDLQHVVRSEKISVVRAASLEQDRRSREKSEGSGTPPAQHRSNRTFGILFTVVILLLLGAGALFGVYTVMQSMNSAPKTAVTSSILFAESSVVFPLDNRAPDDIKRALASARTSQQGALGSITNIIPTITTTNADGSTGTRPATFAEFMQAIQAHPPDALLRALGSNFFFGIHTVDTNAPLFVIPVTSYDRAFAGMLAWESTMNSDLAPMFTAVPATTKDQNGLPINRTFQDSVLRNYDIRVLNDDAGQTKMYYSFPSQNILVIAESPYSFAEILSRLQAQQKL